MFTECANEIKKNTCDKFKTSSRHCFSSQNLSLFYRWPMNEYFVVSGTIESKLKVSFSIIIRSEPPSSVKKSSLKTLRA